MNQLQSIVEKCKEAAMSTPQKRFIVLDFCQFNGFNFNNIMLDLESPVFAFESWVQYYETTNEIKLELNPKHIKLLRWEVEWVSELAYRVIDWSKVLGTYILSLGE